MRYFRNSRYGKTKYGNKKIIIDGYKFDSLKEGNRYRELKCLKKAREIKDFTIKPCFILVPPLKKVHRGIKYEADFSIRLNTGQIVVEDVKGFKTSVYKIKKILMLHILGITIKEI